MTDESARKIRQSNRRKKKHLPFDSQSERRQQQLFDAAQVFPNAEADAVFREAAKQHFCRVKGCAQLALPDKHVCRDHHEHLQAIVKGQGSK